MHGAEATPPVFPEPTDGLSRAGVQRPTEASLKILPPDRLGHGSREQDLPVQRSPARRENPGESGGLERLWFRLRLHRQGDPWGRSPAPSLGLASCWPAGGSPMRWGWQDKLQTETQRDWAAVAQRADSVRRWLGSFQTPARPCSTATQRPADQGCGFGEEGAGSRCCPADGWVPAGPALSWDGIRASLVLPSLREAEVWPSLCRGVASTLVTLHITQL